MENHSSTRDDQISDTFNIRFLLQRESKFKENLGMGAAASVYAAVYRDNPVAIKVFTPNIPEFIVQREIQFMNRLRGEYHVVQYIGRYVEPENKCVCLVMEVAYNLTLAEFLENSIACLSRELRIRLAREVCLGIRALHGNGIAHEDIKTENVLLNFGLRPKVCDFGSAMFLSEVDYPALSGTKHKKAPEKERGGPYNRLCSDIFSLGLVLDEVLRGLEEFSELLSKCKSEVPEARPSCDQILAALPTLELVGYSRFITVNHSLKHLEESEKFNISYHWTEYDPDEDSRLIVGRTCFFKGLYHEAYECFSNCEEPVAGVFLGIMKFHGFGPCVQDLITARKHFEASLDSEEFEDKRFVKGLIYYYLAMALMSTGEQADEERSRRYLADLHVRGNALGPTTLANVHSQMYLTLEPGSYKRKSAKYLFNAVKAGYSREEAFLTLFYIYNNEDNKIPALEKEYLKKSVEAGCVLGRVLLDFVNNAINEKELLETKNPELFLFLGSLYHVTKRTQLARRWFTEAFRITGFESEAAAHIAATFEDEGEPEAALTWLLKAKELSTSLQPAITGSYDETFTMSPLPSWPHRLAEKYLNEGRLDEARSIIDNTCIVTNYELRSTCAFALKSSAARCVLREARCSLSNILVFVLATVYQQAGLRDEAIEWLEESVRRGIAEALNSLGSIFFKERDFHAAKDFFQQGADAGSAGAMYNLGFMEREAKNFGKALHYLEKAVSKSHPPAMAVLAQTLVQIDKAKHLERAKALLKLCSDLGNDSFLWALVGLFQEEETSEIMYWMDRAFRNVDPAIIAEIGIAFDITSTAEIVNRAARGGTAQALHNKGLWIYSGLEETMLEDEDEDEEAYKYFSMAAEMGHIDAMSLCFAICDDRNDRVGAAKWTSLLEQNGFRGHVQRMIDYPLNER